MEKKFWITSETVDVNDCINNVIRPEAGAICTFIGTAREFTDGKRTLHLEYQAYVPMAEQKLKQIGKEIDEKWGDTNTSIAHRTGRLDISEVAVAIAVSTPHRKDAFEACEYAINRIKELVPIWKKEHWEDGSEWIGDQKEQTSYEKGLPSKEELKNG